MPIHADVTHATTTVTSAIGTRPYHGIPFELPAPPANAYAIAAAGLDSVNAMVNKIAVAETCSPARGVNIGSIQITTIQIT